MTVKIITIAAAITLAGCTSTIHKTSQLGHISALSIDAKQRLIVTNPNGGPIDKRRAVVCAEPSPDALVAQAAAISANLKTPKAVEAAFGAANTEAAGSIGLRTQTIQILRDGYYRICEAFMNGSITSEQYKEVIQGVDEFITVVAAIETLGGGTQAPAIKLTPGGTSTTANKDGAAASTTAGNVEIGELKQADGTLNKYQAGAIADVVHSYLTHKEKIARLKSKRR